MITEATSIADPDSLLPDQYFDGSRLPAGVTSERKLMLAILRDAVESYQRHMFARTPRGRDEFDEARAWIDSTDVEWIFSFENICAILGIDAQYIRDGLAKIVNARSASPERKRRTPRIIPLLRPGMEDSLLLADEPAPELPQRLHSESRTEGAGSLKIAS